MIIFQALCKCECIDKKQSIQLGFRALELKTGMFFMGRPDVHCQMFSF